MTQEEKTIEHARFGLTNAQNTIAFIDKKIAAGIAIVSVILGLVFPKAFVWSAVKASLARASEIDWSVVFVFVFCVFGLVSIVFVAIHAYKTIFPRTPSFSREWVLFPFSIANVDEKSSLFKTMAEKLSSSGMKDAEILEEFRDQLAVLGGIQAKKMIHCKATFQWLGWFLFSLLGLFALSFFVNGVVAL